MKNHAENQRKDAKQKKKENIVLENSDLLNMLEYKP